MEETVLVSPEFRKAAANMSLASVNVDLPYSWDWKERFKIRMFPTYVVTDAHLREIGRTMGSKSEAAFVAWIHKQEKFKNKPLEALDPEKGGDEDRLRLGEFYLVTEQNQKVIEVLGSVKSPEADLLRARAEVSAAKDRPEDLKKLFARIVPLYDGHNAERASVDVLEWIERWAELDPKQRPRFTKTLPRIVANLIRAKNVRQSGDSDVDIYEQAGGASEKLDKSLSQRFYRECAKASLRPEFGRRGGALEAAGCWFLAGDTAKATNLMEQLSAEFSNDYVFPDMAAHWYMRSKNYTAALSEIEEAEKVVPPANRMSVLMLKAKILEADQKFEDARKVCEEAIAQFTVLPDDADHGDGFRYQLFRDMLARLKQKTEPKS